MTGEFRALVCGGRAVNDALQPVGEPCGRTYLTGHSRNLHNRARAAGWQITELGDGSVYVCCDRCRRPDPQLVADCRTLQRQARR